MAAIQRASSTRRSPRPKKSRRAGREPARWPALVHIGLPTAGGGQSQAAIAHEHRDLGIGQVRNGHPGPAHGFLQGSASAGEFGVQAGHEADGRGVGYRLAVANGRLHDPRLYQSPGQTQCLSRACPVGSCGGVAGVEYGQRHPCFVEHLHKLSGAHPLGAAQIVLKEQAILPTVARKVHDVGGESLFPRSVAQGVA